MQSNMDIKQLETEANRLSLEYSARWTRAARNQHLFFVYEPTAGTKVFAPLKYLALVHSGGDPNSSKINPDASSVAEVEAIVQKNGFKKISLNHPSFEQIFEEYLVYYRSLGGSLPKDYASTRRRLASQGRTFFWVLET